MVSHQLRQQTSLRFDFRLIFAYADSVPEDRSKNALLIAASLIAAVRLAREEIKPTPRVLCAISDSIRLAQMVLSRIESDRADRK